MGLIITTEINTDSGSTSNAYINLAKFNVIKGGGVRAFVNLYLNKEVRDINDKDTALSKDVTNRFGIGSEELDSSDIYSSLYAKLKSILEEAGLTVEDDI